MFDIKFLSLKNFGYFLRSRHGTIQQAIMILSAPEVPFTQLAGVGDNVHQCGPLRKPRNSAPKDMHWNREK